MNDIYEVLLFQKPWIKYNIQFVKDSIQLIYPDCLIFSAHLVQEHLIHLTEIYKKYPYALKYDINKLNTVNWKTVKLTFDSSFKLIDAPSEILELEKTVKLLDYNRSSRFIFGINPFYYVPVKICNIFVIIVVLFFIVILPNLWITKKRKML